MRPASRPPPLLLPAPEPAPPCSAIQGLTITGSLTTATSISRLFIYGRFTLRPALRVQTATVQQQHPVQTGGKLLIVGDDYKAGIKVAIQLPHQRMDVSRC